MNTNIKITSDLHFGHDNIIDYCNRPCTKDNMTEYLIDTINSKVNINDNVYHLGDFAYSNNIKYKDLINIINRLNGKWYFLLGNHDKPNQLKQLCKDTNNVFLGYYHKIKYKNKTIVLFHYPIENWEHKHRGSIHLHGHSHNNTDNIITNRFNVCFDVHHSVLFMSDIIKQHKTIMSP